MANEYRDRERPRGGRGRDFEGDRWNRGDDASRGMLGKMPSAAETATSTEGTTTAAP